MINLAMSPTCQLVIILNKTNQFLMNRQKTIRCEDALYLISRHLDGDISKEETWQIHHHTTTCSDCQAQMEELAAIELDLSVCHQSLNSYSLDNQFNARIMSALAEEEKNPSLVFSWQQLLKKINFFRPLTQTRLFPVAIGFLGSFLIFFLLGPLFLSSQDSLQRFSIAEIPFNQAQDEVQWNHEQTIPPGQVAEFVINKSDQESIHFRMSSSQPVRILVRHNGNDQDIQMQGIRYATLKTPQINDAVMIRNDGSSPIRVNAHSTRPQQLSLKATSRP